MLAQGEIKADRYRVIRLLGEGAMKRVYLAADQRLSDRPCALAEILENIPQDAQRQVATSAFQREAQMLATLEHPAIPKVYDFFGEGSLHYLVMEYVEGETLEAILAQRQRLPWREAARIGIQVLNALAFLHGRNPPVLYRDLKPSNVMVGPDRRVRIVDFGIARHFKPANTATMVGTLGYAPPEQYKGKNEPRSDLYSFGAVMHHAVTGRDPAMEPPFSFPPACDIAEDCDPGFGRLIDSCLAYDPARRPATALEARVQLANLLSGRIDTAHVDNGKTSAVTILLPEDQSNATFEGPARNRLLHCKRCGYQYEADDKFCNSCGAPAGLDGPSSMHSLPGVLGWLFVVFALFLGVAFIIALTRTDDRKPTPTSEATAATAPDNSTTQQPPDSTASSLHPRFIKYVGPSGESFDYLPQMFSSVARTDGEFVSLDGLTRVAVTSTLNAGQRTIEQLFEDARSACEQNGRRCDSNAPKGQPYCMQKERFFVVTCNQTDQQFYSRTSLSPMGSRIYTLTITSPLSAPANVYKGISRMSRSFRPGTD